MSGITATITFDTGPLSGVLLRLRAAAADMRAPLEEVGAVLVANTQMRFETSTGPGGTPWKQSLRVKLFGGQTLRESGRLMGSFVHQVVGNTVEWGSNVIYAAIHQFGGTIVPKKPGGRLVFGALESEQTAEGKVANPLVFAQKVVIPARPMIGFDDRDLIDTREVLVNHLVRIARGDPDVVFA